MYGVKLLDLLGIYNSMSMIEDYEDDFEDISLEEEIEILDEAYNNAYLVATKKVTIKELLEGKHEIMFLPFDPSEPYTLELIMDDMIEYFESNEEYEKCSELVKVKQEMEKDNDSQ